MTAQSIRPYGARALLVTPARGVLPAALANAVRTVLDVVEVVPGAETVLVVMRDSDSRDSLGEWLTSHSGDVDGLEGDGADAPDVVIDVVYDGVDLAAVADASGLSVDEVIARHSGGTYVADFCGFAPGFAYLSGLDPLLQLPRRASPRASVPAGSVAIAGPNTAVYPTASPGGWHLLGRTDVELFDPSAVPPALITPGTRITFRPVSSSGRRESRIPGLTTPRSGDGTQDTQIEGRVLVVAPGISTSLQDRGRPGYAHLGVPGSGALDGAKHDLVNRLVGNDIDAAVIETAGRLVLEALAPVTIADSTTGAVQALVRGDTIAVNPAAGDLWAYVAVRGGFAAEPVLGSRSWDSLSKLGPPPPEPGAVLGVGPDPGAPVAIDQAPPAPSGQSTALRVRVGPRADWFAADALTTLTSASWTVSTSSRVGVRLAGHPVRRARDGELPSEGLVTGAVQVPPDGQPVVMLNDHPTTGGYPVLAVIDERDIGALAQARPGTIVRLKEVTR